jgi:putative transposase
MQPKDAAKQVAKQEVVKQLVDRERKLLPRIGTRKIHYLIKEDLQRQELKCGRDKLFTLMRYYGSQIKPRHRYIQTTMSKH